MVYKIILAYISSLIAILCLIPYFVNVLFHKTKPHAFSWFIWSLLPGIAFFVQISEHAGAGAWISGASASACFIIFILSLFYGQIKFSKFDWVSLSGAIIALILWLVAKNPALSIIFLATTDAFGFLPTFRKSYYHPDQETLSRYIFSFVAWGLALLAVENYSVATWFYQASLLIINGIFVSLVLIRRKQLRRK